MANEKQHMVKFTIYLHRKCRRTQQEGLIWMTEPTNDNKELHFNYLDEIPQKIREHMLKVGLGYEVAENSDDTVIEAKSKKSRVVQKIRLKDLQGQAG